MAIQAMRVVKTLVIGLGSTGTAICNALAERIQWELETTARAPWIRMLCIETDANAAGPLKEAGDMRLISLPASRFQQILSDPRSFDEKLRLTQWLDMNTLRKLPTNEVTSGAGNIRMVGRLAFLYPDNYDAIKQAVAERMSDLRGLSGVDAMERRGPLPDGSNPPVLFEAGEQVRVIVVGTLCGGTCSGIVSDFGYFLRGICREEEKTTGIFTLPNHDLTSALEPLSDRYKKNAYHALIELNHYHLPGRDDESRILFPDNMEPDIHAAPYDLPYLAMPRRIGPEGVMELSRALADRVFLNIFAPRTDPFSSTVDATIPIRDRDRRAHVFCSFGLSTIEFPSQQVMEACTKRLAAYAIGQWQRRPLAMADMESGLREIGLGWENLVGLLTTTPGGGDLRRTLAQKQEEVLSQARSSIDQSERGLAELRYAFANSAATDTSASSLPAGILPRTIQGNRLAAAEAVVESLRRRIHSRLLDYYEGPAPLEQLLDHAIKVLAALRQEASPTDEADARSVDACLQRIRVYHRSMLLGMLFLRRAAIDHVMPELRRALTAEIQQRMKTEVIRSFRSTTQRGETDYGILDLIERRLQPVLTRVGNLRTRLVALANRLSERANALAGCEPEINGTCIFERETSGGQGTVPEEYRRCFEMAADDPADDWTRLREAAARKVIAAWSSLPDAVLPAGKPEDDWLLRPVLPDQTASLIPASSLREIERTASQPFQCLASVDVLDRWQRHGSIALQEAEGTAKLARPFLEIIPALAERGNRSSVSTRRMILVPNGPQADSFVQAAAPGLSGYPDRDCSPDEFRAIIIEEWYRFPLSGAPSVLGSQGLHAAKCSDFPSFHSRKDVYWTGLSDEQVAHLMEAEQLVAVAVILGVLQPRDGFLEMDWARAIPGDPGKRRLPLSLRGAAQFLVDERMDLTSNNFSPNGLPLTGARIQLAQRVEHIRKSGAGEPRERDLAFVQSLEKKLMLGNGTVLRDWNGEKVGTLIMGYCAGDADLYAAYKELYPPDSATISHLWRRAGDPRPLGGTFEEDGYYCIRDGGLIGKTEEEAARNGWRCYVDPSHDFSPVSAYANR